MWPFYVYELVDPRDGAVFYVGKGKGRRLDAHESEARRGVASAKCSRIREIWQARKQVIRREIARFRLEAHAYEFEAQRIALYSGLTNVVLNDATLAKNRPSALHPYFLRVVAWWLRETDGGRLKPSYASDVRPWSAALMNAVIGRGKSYYKMAEEAAGSFEELALRLQPFGIELVRAYGSPS